MSVNKVITLGKISENEILRLACIAEAHSTHPAALAIKEYSGRSYEPGENYRETPGMGVSVNIDGHVILCGGSRILNGQTIPGQMSEAMVFLLCDGALEGAIELTDTIRDDAKKTIDTLKNLNIKQIVMLTGDSKSAAEKVAKQSGIDEFNYGLLPENKLDLLNSIRSQAGHTIFVGDGINDAPVLAAADVGAAMGLGSDAAIEVADMVIASNRLSSLPAAIKIFRQTMSIVRFNIVFALSTKGVVLILAALGFAPMWLAVFADVGVSILSVLNSGRINIKRVPLDND